MEEFVACFADVPDPRQDNARHDLHEMLMIALCTVLCGGEGCSDMALFGHAKEPFLLQFLTLAHGIPSHDTFIRLFRPELTKRPDLTVKGTNPEQRGFFYRPAGAFGVSTIHFGLESA